MNLKNINVQSDNEVYVTYTNCSFSGGNINGKPMFTLKPDGETNEIYFDGWECYGPVIDIKGEMVPREMPSKKIARLEKEVEALSAILAEFRENANI